MTKNLAPIGISVYSRVSHLERTIEALLQNSLANESEVFFFSDAAQKGDEALVEQMREYLSTIEGFRKVHIVERELNSRKNNNRTGIKFLLDNYGKLIWLEEDIVTAPGFLKFMNDALRFYENDTNILSITGYCPPIFSKKMEKDSFILKRFTAWGFATWRHKFDPLGFEIDKRDYDVVMQSRSKIKAFEENGRDMLPMVTADYKKEIDALDVKVMFYQFINNQYTLYPTSTLVQNIGHDGTGVHCGVSTKFDVFDLWDKKEGFFFEENPCVDPSIVQKNYDFRNYGFKTKLVHFFKTGLKKLSFHS